MSKFNVLNNYGEELEKLLLLRTYPIAVKLLKNEKEIPEGATRPKRDLGYHLALCQCFALSRREGTLIAMLKEDMWCYSPVIAFGIAEPPEFYLEGHVYYPVVTRTLEKAKDLVKKYPRFEYGQYIGIASAPLKTANFKPDLVIIYCDPAQLRPLLAGIKYQEGELVTSTLDPSSACIQATIPVIKSGNCQVTLPCGGDRKWALSQDNEIIFTSPLKKLESLVLGVRHLHEAGQIFPAKFEMSFEYSLDETLTKVCKMVGIDVHD
jgi:uncharacterized protein (DUF169 family)